MLTKSVVACMLSGTLAGSIFLGGPLATDVHAKKIVARKATKVGRVATGARKVAVHPPQRHPASSPTRNRCLAARTLARPVFSASLHRHPRRTVTTSLGTFTVRAYTHYRPAGAVPQKTATGTLPTAGRTVAVDPRVIPLGSKIHIAGVGERIAEDTGGQIKGKRLDLFLSSTNECRKFGVQTQEVRLLAE